MRESERFVTISSGQYKTLLWSIQDRIATVIINRPEKLNALNKEVKAELESAFLQARSDAGIDAVIVSGSGEKAFVAGTDIGELTSLNAATGKEFSERGQRLLDLIENLGKPVIAAINGYALGGGCELALACHIRFASETAKFGQPEVNLGIIPGYGGTQRLARIVGQGRALDMILTGIQVDAQEALRIGLVSRVFPPAELMQRTLNAVRVITSAGQVAVRKALEAVLAGMDNNLARGQALEAELFGACCATDDFKEGTGAFLEKRKPRFLGR